MIRSNSKKAIENVKAYIVDHFTPDGYTDNPPADFPGICAFVLDTFRAEFIPNANARRYYGSEQNAFRQWCAGLPSVIDTCYFYNRSAVDDLGEILEETDEEKAKYTEEQAQDLLTWLIYRELLKGEKKC